MAYYSNQNQHPYAAHQTLTSAGPAAPLSAGPIAPASFRRTYQNVHQAVSPPHSLGYRKPANLSAPLASTPQPFVYPELKTTYLSPPPIESPHAGAPAYTQPPPIQQQQPQQLAYLAPPHSYSVGYTKHQHYSYQQPMQQSYQAQYTQYSPTDAYTLPAGPVHPDQHHMSYQPPVSAASPVYSQSPPPPLQQQQQQSLHHRQSMHAMNVSAPSWASGKPKDTVGRLLVAYHRHWERQRAVTTFFTLHHCLEPVNLLSAAEKAAGGSPGKGNLLPLFKANEEWIMPDVGMPLENRPGYRCIMYIVDGAGIYDYGLGGDKVYGKGTLLMSTTGHDASAYIRNPSKTHPIHVLRLWIDITTSPTSSAADLDNDSGVNLDHSLVHDHARAKPSPTSFADFTNVLRHIADSDKRNCLLTVLQPRNYWPQYGMTSKLFGPVDQTNHRMTTASSSYYLSQSMTSFTRPSYFSPDSAIGGSANGSYEWTADSQMTGRACADPLLVDEDIFISICYLDANASVTYQSLDSFDKHRNQASGKRRRVWIQNVMMNLNPDNAENSGRLVINGDKVNRMRPGDSAYVRKLMPTESLNLYNCGRSGIEFIVIETPY